jgi:hypothetical protein
VTAEQQATANKCRHARLGYLDGQPGTWDDIVARLRDLDHHLKATRSSRTTRITRRWFHVLWSAGINGAQADELASKIMQSKWLRAVRLHAAPRNTVQLPDADTL